MRVLLTQFQVAAVAGLTTVAITTEFDSSRIIWAAFSLFFAVAFDQVGVGGWLPLQCWVL